MRSIETIRGVPQPVYKFSLRNIPAAAPTERLEGIEIPQLVERVIIGPTQYPTAVCEAIVESLLKLALTLMTPGSELSSRVFAQAVGTRRRAIFKRKFAPSYCGFVGHRSPMQHVGADEMVAHRNAVGFAARAERPESKSETTRAGRDERELSQRFPMGRSSFETRCRSRTA